MLPPTSSTCTDFLCKIEQLNGLNKSDDKTLIAIFLPPSLKRAICRHLERYFIKQKRKQSRKFLVNLPPEPCGSRALPCKGLRGFYHLGSRVLQCLLWGSMGMGSLWPLAGQCLQGSPGGTDLRPRFQPNGSLQIAEDSCLIAQGLPFLVLYQNIHSFIFCPLIHSWTHQCVHSEYCMQAWALW